MSDLRLAPGCYGSAIAYEEGSVECSTCPFYNRCGPMAQANLRRIHESLKIPLPEKLRHKISVPLSINPFAHPIFEGRKPRKIAELMQTIDARGFKVKELLLKGVNPFDKKPEFLRIAGRTLLRRGSVSREILATIYQHRLGIETPVAQTYARQAFQVLAAYDAVTIDNDHMTLRKP